MDGASSRRKQPQDPAARSACVFCGATDRKISKEHVFPKWLRKLRALGALCMRKAMSRVEQEQWRKARAGDWPRIGLFLQPELAPG